jgi:hypothetical protein
MSSINDENQLIKCLDSIIKLIEETLIEDSSYTNQNNNSHSKKDILEKITTNINQQLKNTLDILSNQYRQYFLDLFKDYNYNYQQGNFQEIIKSYIIKQLLNDLNAIKYSFQAFQAAFDGNLTIVKHFIQNYPAFKDNYGIWGTTLLYSSSRNNHIHIVKYLIEQGKCLVNRKNQTHKELNATSGSTALHAACFYGHLNIVKYLIENDGDYFIKNDAQETPIQNGLSRKNVREFFIDYLICSYSHSTNILPESTVEDDHHCKSDSIWEYKSINSNQWIQFQSNQLEQSLTYQTNHNYNQTLTIQIDNQTYDLSIITFLALNKSNNEHSWIRCRGSSIENYNFYSKWQIMFDQHPSIKSFKSPSLDIFYLDDNIDHQIPIELNHWYYSNDSINKQLNNATNYRRKYFSISIPQITNQHLIEFNLQTFSFTNSNKTITGFIRWIPIIISNKNNNIIDNFTFLTNEHLIPLFREDSNNNYINQSTINNQQVSSTFIYKYNQHLNKIYSIKQIVFRKVLIMMYL